MKITSIYLRGYRRLALSQIAEITIEPSSIHQIILGTNGSGKSSLLGEISPLPAQPNDFYTDGEKRVKIEHRGHHYELISILSSSPKHYFYKDGVEHNENNKISIQRQLVQDEFGITPQLMDLLSGKLSFTQMTPAKRREWIIAISDIDLSYAYSVYQQVATHQRDQKGALKHLQSRITQETNRLESENCEELAETVNQLQEELTALMEHRRKDIDPSENVWQTMQIEYETIADMLKELQGTMHLRGHRLPEGKESWQSVVEETRNDVTVKQKLYQQTAQEYEQLHHIVGSLHEEGLEDLDELRKKQQQYQQEIQELEKNIYQFTFNEDVTPLVQDAPTFYQQMQEVLHDLPDNREGHYHQKALEQSRKTIDDLRHQLRRYQAQKQKQEEHLQHLQSTEPTTCPKCEYQFRIGVTDQDIENAKTDINKHEQHIENLQQKLDEQERFHQEVEHYLQQYQRLRQLAYHYPKARSLFEYLIEGQRINNQPSQYVQTVESYLRDAKTTHKIQEKRRHLRSIEEVLEKTEHTQHTSQNHLSQRAQELQKEMEEIADQLRNQREQLQHLQTLQKQIQRREELVASLQQRIERYKERYTHAIEVTRQSQIVETIRQHQNDLADKNHRLQQHRHVEKTLESLKASLSEVEEDHQYYKLLQRALSPEDGIIGEQIYHFIACWVEQLNEIIGQIYTYPLEVQPCPSDKQELEFRFPLLSGEERLPVEDISKASEGQREIIDFAFQLIALLYLQFEDYPLFLDEIGSNQDETHLTLLMDYIKMMIDSGRHSQLFMISHQAVGHGAFNKADVLVLNRANITVPVNYNQHATIA